ncbi:type II toxin-antitoxin system Phd/YefM family antitoxin [Sandaracinobacteroides saxicola]|uniref:Antitoxin n=1 Tax=Sandaracinobacteroides saxicola TaxID=2759707 RepID=A0A7G5IEC6_9SPHN|nr:type II toxin-antitoxin system prevent-host-death family antitoxin [Sandaracinobacteroides saxicola]QMW21718.1 type II toxin-antitoxin system prevent-host-death family antitoxin [Sandaracinobacteroides saxicola]
MDIAITATDANQRFSEVLRDIQAGETFIVTSHGRPVARLLPIDHGQNQTAAIDLLLDHLNTLPPRTLPGWQRDELYT